MFHLTPIAFVRGSRQDLGDDFWGDARAIIELAPDVPAESLLGIEGFSHLEIFFIFHHDAADAAPVWTRHPRGNDRWPRTGILAQRARRRPNRLGATIVRLEGRDDTRIHVIGLDAADGTPIVDIKPVFAEFLPREPVRQPAWTRELMADYWRPATDRTR